MFPFSFIHRLFSGFVRHLSDFLFPKSSRVIELENLSSIELLNLLPKPYREPDEGVTALFDYTNSVVKEIIWEMKYNGNKTLADRLGEILYDNILSVLNEQNIFERFHTVLLMPMPISDKRRFERGWNQAELLAAAIKLRDKAQQFKYLPRQLAKHRDTLSQTKTSNKSERKENLKNSMRVLNPESVRDRCVVLIDDVVTTGSTFHEAKRALRNAGAKKIFCFAVSH